MVGMVIIMAFVAACLGLRSYWPSPVTNRDLLDYGDEATLLFDAREAAYGALQAKANPDGRIPLQSLAAPDWALTVSVTCAKPGCDNVLTPEGIRLLLAMDKLVEEDPYWRRVCYRDAAGENCAADARVGGRVAKASPLPIFSAAYGDDLSDLTQYAIDFALFGLAYEQELFEYTKPLFSKDYTRTHRKAKAVRFLLLPAGPIEAGGVRYSHMRDRSEAQEFAVASW